MSLVTGVLLWVILVSLLVLLLDRLKGRRASRTEDDAGDVLPYIRKGKLFTPAEASFYHVLKSAVGHQYAIFGKVRVADLLSPQKGLSKSDWQKHFNLIKAKHVDFILCDPDTLQVMCAIELDDPSHTREKRVKRDSFLDKAFQAAALPLVRIKTRHTYAEAQIIEHLRDSIELPDSTPAPEPVQSAPIQREAAALPPASGKACPNCGLEMLRKRAVKGPHMGEEFWVCPSFPTCRTTIPIAKQRHEPSASTV